MDTNGLKKFAQSARNLLIDQVTARLDMVLAEGAPARREHPKAIAKLEAAANSNRAQVIEYAAYTWFNRFTALRFMDVTGLTNPRVVSPADGATRPEILAEAMAGNLPDRARPEIAEYLNGTRPAHDGQAEAYRLLLIHACNEWHGAMPYMFERADMLDRAEDYTELLIPGDLLSPDSILARLRDVMTEEACQDVEIIGWLYQFYISEKKDQVFAGLKKNQKITAENIPAATQLFTPHWIVRYLVENSLGRLWLLNRQQSKLAAKMDYYIAPEEPETDFLRITRPEDIRICDPACGSGHMLTYAFDLLYEIYAEEGHDSADIPGLILKHNLTGIEIDDRAGALAAFALSMKAAAKLGRRRFLRMEAKPDIVVLQDVHFTPAEMQDVAAVVGKDLFTDELRETLGQFEQAKNFGSLIVPKLRDPAETLRVVEARDFGSDLLLKEVQKRVIALLHMAEALSPKYHVVVANPPYAGAKGLNEELSSYITRVFPEGKNDLMTSFIIRATLLSNRPTLMAFVTLDSWMFISSFEEFRDWMSQTASVTGMLHVGWNCFPEGHVYNRGTGFILKTGVTGASGCYIDLSDVPATVDKQSFFFGEWERPANRFRASLNDFSDVPGKPLAYALSDGIISAYHRQEYISTFLFSDGLTKTGDNERFLRFHWEISKNKRDDNNCFRTCIKGGESRKHFGNTDVSVDWHPASRDHYRKDHVARISPEYLWDRDGITWTKVSSKGPTFRWFQSGMIAETGGPSVFLRDGVKDTFKFGAIGFLNSKVSMEILERLSPTINVQTNDVLNLPVVAEALSSAHATTEQIITLSEADWAHNERAREFQVVPLLSSDHRGETLAVTYANLRVHWRGMTGEMQRLEEENNRIFIDAYGLQDELTPEVPIEEITLTCNPAYRYGVKGTEEEREARLLQDTMAEFLHYAVGCMFGRYSLDAPGLILANQGEGIEEYLARVPEPTFAPDRDNVIPVLDADWFADDIVIRARDFLRLTFGETKFRENLAFIEAALGKNLRKWFTKDFFDYHLRRYKKRPIYWMFSSPKGSFNALIYMHRYRPDTVSVVLNQYVREFIHKLEVERARLEKLAVDPAATPAQQTKAQKETATVIKQIAELTEWERDVVYPMAQKKIAIDLDDGVKRNYPLFAGALKPIKGLEVADD